MLARDRGRLRAGGEPAARHALVVFCVEEARRLDLAGQHAARVTESARSKLKTEFQHILLINCQRR